MTQTTPMHTIQFRFFPRRLCQALLTMILAFGSLVPALACAKSNAADDQLNRLSTQQSQSQQQSATDTTQDSVKRTPDVIFVPTPMEVVNEMLSVTKVGKMDTLYDLGSGDGRIVITAAKRFGTKGIGIDIDPERIKESRHNADTAGVTNVVEFRQADLFKTDLRNATVVTLYLLPRLNVQLRPKLFAELRPGTRIVSHAFDMADWRPDSVITVDSRSVFYWMIPANVAGTWTVQAASGKQTYEVKFEQQFQQVTGSAIINGKTVPLNDIHVEGGHIRFSIPTDDTSTQFEGTVTGSTIRGTAPYQWSATRTEKNAPAIAD